MWSFVLYVLAVVVGLVLVAVYDSEKERAQAESADSERSSPLDRRRRTRTQDYRLGSLFAVLGLSEEEHDSQEATFTAFQDHFSCLQEVTEACQKAGLEHSNLIIGVDFTASNEWQGRKSFNQHCLHRIQGSKITNPYQKVIWILGSALRPFDEDNLIPAYGFGDQLTTDDDVFPFKPDESSCLGFHEVLERYNHYARTVSLSGPTSFAPIITKAIQIVRRTRGYHILVIIADGQVNEEGPTIEAILEASKYPISIIVVGVGDGPWDVMEEFDHRLPKRKFDNFRFVDYHKTTLKSKNPDAAFALQALMEIPDQYKRIRALGYLDRLGVAKATHSRNDSGQGDSQASSRKHSPTGVVKTSTSL